MFNKLFGNTSPPPPGAVDLSTYRRYREAGRDLAHKIIDTQMNSAIIGYAARTLKLGGKKQLVLENEDELSVMMDFALYEYRLQGQSLIEHYRDTVDATTPLERELLAAMSGATTALFRVEDILPAAGVLQLTNLLDPADNLPMMDINFSRTAQPGLLLFVRPVRLPRFNMTSGFSFAFPPKEEAHLLKLAQHPNRRGDAPPGSVRRFETFFKQSRRRGLDVMLEQS